MRRREFGKALFGAAAGAGLGKSLWTAEGATPRHISRKNTKMHVSTDYHVVEGKDFISKENFSYNLRFGVSHINPDPVMVAAGSGPPKAAAKSGWGDFIAPEGPQGGAFDLDALQRMRDACDAAGIILEGFRMDSGYIVMKAGAERDRKLDQVCENIRKTRAVGVGLISQHWTAIPIRRNGTRPGRGDSVYSTFKLEPDWKGLATSPFGKLSFDEYWERIEVFLKRVIPVCKEYDVNMANHPYDPPGLPWGYEGVGNFDSPSIFDAYKRYAMIVDDPHNGFQMDLGVLAEGSTDPNRQIPPLVQWLADRGRIHQIHMRAIQGGLNDFAEVYHDEGVLDFFPILRILRDSGFSGGILPDHVPASPGDPGKLQGYAFAYGYIKALIQAANSDVG
ncbi:MAG: mannonate dehydratase [Acidobacteriaceae bacterium]